MSLYSVSLAERDRPVKHILAGTALLRSVHLYLTSLVAHCLSQHLHIFKLRAICLHCNRNAHGAGLTIHCILQRKVWSHYLLGAGAALRALILQGTLARCPSLRPSSTRSHVVAAGKGLTLLQSRLWEQPSAGPKITSTSS